MTPSGDTTARERPTLRQILIVLPIVIILLWVAGEIFLLAIGGTLVAVFLNTLAAWLSNHTRLGYRAALAIVIIVLVTAAGATLWLIGTHLAMQINELSKALPHAIEQVKAYLKEHAWSDWLIGSSAGKDLGTSSLPTHVTHIAQDTMHFLVDIVIMLFVGVYCAIEPDFYRTGIVRLVPIPKRKRAEQVLTALAFNLRWWLLGQLISMLVLAVVIGLAMFFLGVPLALVLGLLAGLFEIVPNIGPVLWLVPAMLVALLQGPTQVLHVFLVYCVLHLFESYVLMPFVQRRAVWLPPAVSILSIAFLGLITGILGMIVAAPLAVIGLVLVKMLYIEDRLGDHDIEVPGEPA